VCDKNNLKTAIKRLNEIVVDMPPSKANKELLDILQKMTEDSVNLK